MTTVLSAATDEGGTLPVIDVTNPAFRVSVTDADLDAMCDRFVRDSTRQRHVPAFAYRLLVRSFLQRSTLGRGLLAATGSFLGGLDTYLLKIGPENLPGWATDADRRIAESFPAFATRLRLQDMAELLAEGMEDRLRAEPSRRLLLINIAGGPAADSLNALMLLHREAPALLKRDVRIVVLDLDERGPAFGARALEALRAPDAPLSGLEIAFERIDYRWSDARRLSEILERAQAHASICGVSSEGGLFEYGSDDDIVANLEALRAGTPAGTIMVGSVTRDGEPVRLTQVANRVPTRPRTLEAFQRLVEQSGWHLERVRARPFSYNVGLT